MSSAQFDTFQLVMGMQISSKQSVVVVVVSVSTQKIMHIFCYQVILDEVHLIFQTFAEVYSIGKGIN